MDSHRGRLIDHVQLVVRDLAASRQFYTSVLEVLGVPLSGDCEHFFWADERMVSDQQFVGADAPLTGRGHLAFQAGARETVQRFHAAALTAGGSDNGAPGERGRSGYFAAFVLDPDGNNVEAVHHGPA